jgi:hypothetical protein
MENLSYLTEIKARLTYRQAYVHVKNLWGKGGSEYFNFLFAYLVITYYSLQFLSNGDTK